MGIKSNKSGKLVSPIGIAFYVSLAQKKVWKDKSAEDAKYEISLAFTKDQINECDGIRKAQIELRERCFGAKATDVKLAFKPTEVEGLGTFYTLKLKTSFPFGVILADGTKISGADVRDGNLVRVSFEFAANDVSGSKTISAYLANVQKISEGSGVPEGLGRSSTSPEEDFADDSAIKSFKGTVAKVHPLDDEIPF